MFMIALYSMNEGSPKAVEEARAHFAAAIQPPKHPCCILLRANNTYRNIFHEVYNKDGISCALIAFSSDMEVFLFLVMHWHLCLRRRFSTKA
jgi:hypothetical protein